MARRNMKNCSFCHGSSTWARYSSRLFAACVVVLTATLTFGHDDEDGGTDRSGHVSIKTQGDKRVIESNGIPDHRLGQFPNRGNPNSISAQHYHFEIPL